MEFPGSRGGTKTGSAGGVLRENFPNRLFSVQENTHDPRVRLIQVDDGAPAQNGFAIEIKSDLADEVVISSDPLFEEKCGLGKRGSHESGRAEGIFQ